MHASALSLRDVLEDTLVAELALAILDPAVAGTFIGESTIFAEFACSGAVPAPTHVVLAFTLRR